MSDVFLWYPETFIPLSSHSKIQNDRKANFSLIQQKENDYKRESRLEKKCFIVCKCKIQRENLEAENVFYQNRLGDFWFPVQHVRGLKLPLHSYNMWKAKQTKKSTTILRSIREMESQGKLLHPKSEEQTGRHREAQLTRAETQEQKYPWEQVLQ